MGGKCNKRQEHTMTQDSGPQKTQHLDTQAKKAYTVIKPMSGKSFIFSL